MYKLDECPYCKDKISLKRNDVIYGQIYGNGWVYICNNYPECDSYVGTHTNKNPLGRLANKELRDIKSIAHLLFDSLWKLKKVTQNDKKARKKAYDWLAIQMNKNINDTHIGYFNYEETKKVIQICKPYVKKIIKKHSETPLMNYINVELIKAYIKKNGG